MHYSRIALTLQEISLASRSHKVDLIAEFLSEVGPDIEILCPVVRLLLGELWPPWEKREMGIGPETIMAALADVSDQDLPSLRERLLDMGMVAEAALRQKGQHSLFQEPLEALSVYEKLRRISAINGNDSQLRKNAVMRGLFLEATPLEGMYIARTALRSMQAGIGHKTMIAALSRFLSCDQEEIRHAYSRMPDLGCIAVMAKNHKLQEARFQAKIPIRFMLFRQSDPVLPGCFLPKYPGLRVQVHKIKNEVLIFTSQLRDITISLSGTSRLIEDIESDFVVDADLIGFYDRGDKRRLICSQAEMLRYINRRHLSRKSRIRPSLLAYDLIAFEGEDICGLPYLDRRKKLLSMLGKPKEMPFQGMSPCKEYFLTDKSAVDELQSNAGIVRARSLLERDPEASYQPGMFSERDFIIRAEHKIAAMVVQVSWCRHKGDRIPAKYQVALRSDKELVPVGWAKRGLSENDQLRLSHSLKSLAIIEQDSDGIFKAQPVPSLVLLNLKISGVHKTAAGRYIIHGPEIEGFNLNASPKDADVLEILERISSE